MDERHTSIREMLATARTSLPGRGRYMPPGNQRCAIPTSATQRRIGGPGTLCFKARGLCCDVLGPRGVVFERQYSLGLHPWQRRSLTRVVNFAAPHRPRQQS